MRLAKLRLKDYRTYGDASAEFGAAPVAVVFARNGLGKTGLRDAVSILMTSSVDGLGRGGLTAERLIRHGRQSALVAGEFVRNGKPLAVERRIGARGVGTKLNGASCPNALADFFVQASDADTAVAILANGEAFLSSWDAARQKAAVLSLLPRDIPPAMLEGLPLDGNLPEPRTLDDLEDAYARAVDARRGAKGALAAAAAPQPDQPAPPVDEIETRLRELREAAMALAAEAGELAGEKKALTRSLESAGAEMRKQKDALTKLGTMEDARRAVSLAVDRHTVAKDRAAEWEKGHEAVRKKEASLDALTTAYERLGSLKDQCVIASEEAPLRCPLPQQEKHNVHGSWDKRIKTLGVEIGALKKKLGPKPTASQEDRELSRAKEAVASIEAAERRIAELRSAADDMARRVSEIGADPKAAELDELQRRIGAGEAKLKEANAIARAWDEHRKSVEARRKWSDAVETWDRLATAFGPNGIAVGLIQQRAQDLQDAVNVRLAAFGLSLRFVPDPWEVQVAGSHPALMSRAQRLIASAAFQVVVAQRTGARMIVVDGMDVMDGPNRAAFFGVLEAAAKDGALDQAIVTATYAGAEPPKSLPAFAEGFVLEPTESGTIIRSL